MADPADRTRTSQQDDDERLMGHPTLSQSMGVDDDDLHDIPEDELDEGDDTDRL